MIYVFYAVAAFVVTSDAAYHVVAFVVVGPYYFCFSWVASFWLAKLSLHLLWLLLVWIVLEW